MRIISKHFPRLILNK